MTKTAEVLRILDRYLIEVVERYDLCPWARGARLGGELAAGVVWGEPTIDEWAAEAAALLERPGARVALVVAPELVIEPWALHEVRDRVAARLPRAGIAEFHPAGKLDLATPARLVPFLRRSPDPLLQLVPFALLDAVRASASSADLARQAQLLGGFAQPPRADIADRIAVDNHATVARDPAAIAAVIEAIAADRATAYAAAGISTSARRP